MTRQILLFMSAGILLALISCGGGSSAISTVPNSNPPQGSLDTTLNSSEQAGRNVLSLLLPDLSRLTAGDEVDVILSAQCKDELYQGSGRLAYDSTRLKPVLAKRGAIPANNVFIAKLDTAPATGAVGNGMDGVVPFAFTALPGTSGFGSSTGELLRVRFRLLATPGAHYPVELVNTSEYLQLRNSQGQRLSFDLTSEVASK